MDLAAETAAPDQDEALDALGELVGELHRDPAAEGVADDRGAVVAEGGDEVADAARVGAERVVAARLGRVAVAEQVGRDDRVLGGEAGDDRRPGVRGARDAVQEDEQRALAALVEAHAVTVEDDLFGGYRAHRDPLPERACAHAKRAPRWDARRKSVRPARDHGRIVAQAERDPAATPRSPRGWAAPPPGRSRRPARPRSGGPAGGARRAPRRRPPRRRPTAPGRSHRRRPAAR